MAAAGRSSRRQPIEIPAEVRVATPSEPTEKAQHAGNVSTGAIATPGAAEATVDHHRQPVVVNTPTPGPVTMSLGYLPQAKVVTPPPAPDVQTSTAGVQTKA